jgi:hypothetical protein
MFHRLCLLRLSNAKFQELWVGFEDFRKHNLWNLREQLYRLDPSALFTICKLKKCKFNKSMELKLVREKKSSAKIQKMFINNSFSHSQKFHASNHNWRWAFIGGQYGTSAVSANFRKKIFATCGERTL